MSGICGVLRRDGGAVDPGVLDRMAAAAAHREPDGRTVWIRRPVGLVHQALHVTPTCASDRLPAVSDGVAVTADARLDNTGDLATALSAELAGAAPTPGALLLAGYRRWGRDLPRHLLGDFAFALWDERAHTLVAARDPMGLRPLYYRIEPGRLLFGSEVKQLLVAPDVPADVSEPAAASFLVGGAVPPGWSFYEAVASLPPGHVLEVTPRGWTCRAYWHPDASRRVRFRREEEYAEAFRDVFRDAVRSRMRSPHPVGVFLSGGVDSGSVAATGGRLLADEPSLTPELRAFSFAFTELSQCDEREVSRGIIEAYGLPWTAVPADDAWPLRADPQHPPDRDAPPITWYQYLWHRSLATARSQGAVVILGGDRGDLVAGESVYDHSGLFWRGRWGTLLREIRLLARWQGEGVSRVARRSLLQPLSRALWPDSPPRRWWRRLRSRQPSTLPRPPWVNPAFLAAQGTWDTQRELARATRIGSEARSRRFDAIFTPSQLAGFLESERMYARHGTAFADPFSDLRITEFVLSIPQRVVNRPEDRKRLVKRAMRGTVPEATARAQGKVSPFPLGQRGLREREVETVRTLIRDSEAAKRGWIDAESCLRSYEAYLEGAAFPVNLWCTLSLEQWLQAHHR